MYIDANIPIYLSNKNSIYFAQCQTLLSYCQNHSLNLLTSTATIQEIIHWSAKTNSRAIGLEIAKETLNIIDQLHTISPQTISYFLKLAKKYRLNGGHDLLHLAVCIENNHKEIVTFDSAFKNFTEIRAFTPLEYIEAFSLV